ncbi:MAG: hypothetical protein QM723_18060 [Myxococcaceae bacterium]
MNALDHAKQLRDALSQELERSREARAALVSLDSDELMEGAQRREGFNERAEQLSTQLSQSLTGPREPEVSEVLAEIRAMSGALKELDELNRFLAERALACVRAWGSQLKPGGQAYDRRGVRYAGNEATHSEQA